MTAITTEAKETTVKLLAKLELTASDIYIAQGKESGVHYQEATDKSQAFISFQLKGNYDGGFVNIQYFIGGKLLVTVSKNISDTDTAEYKIIKSAKSLDEALTIINSIVVPGGFELEL